MVKEKKTVKQTQDILRERQLQAGSCSEKLVQNTQSSFFLKFQKLDENKVQGNERTNESMNE